MEEPTIEERDDGIKKKKGDYGVRVARPGYDAGNCSDNQLLFNSNWPIIQIAKVIDFDKEGVELIVYAKQIIDPETWESSWEPTYDKPGGVNFSFEEIEKPEYRVGLKYCYKTMEAGYGYDSGHNYWTACKYKVKQHQLGYIPMWYASEWISDVEGKVVLTNIDISTDIEYPYTDSPTILATPVKDYGIKSSSVFPNVDGLDTGMFSKLVQRVMTTEKSGSIAKQGGKIIDRELLWYASNKKADIDKDTSDRLMAQYEAYGYSAEPSLAKTGFVEYRCFTVEKSYTHRPTQAIFDSSGSRLFVIGLQTTGQDYDNYDKVMVIVRSPMVSPEYEEVVV